MPQMHVHRMLVPKFESGGVHPLEKSLSQGRRRHRNDTPQRSSLTSTFAIIFISRQNLRLFETRKTSRNAGGYRNSLQLTTELCAKIYSVQEHFTTHSTV